MGKSKLIKCNGNPLPAQNNPYLLFILIGAFGATLYYYERPEDFRNVKAKIGSRGNLQNGMRRSSIRLSILTRLYYESAD
jgi:hypothetical protein